MRDKSWVLRPGGNMTLPKRESSCKAAGFARFGIGFATILLMEAPIAKRVLDVR